MMKHLVSLLIPTAFVVFLFYEFSETGMYSDQELREVSERAVTMAREQRYDEAEEQFVALFTVSPDFLPARADHLVVLEWQERHDEMLALAESLPWSQLPGYALEALSRAALARGQPDRAGLYAEQAVHNSGPEGAEQRERALRLGRQLLNADQYEAARRVLARGREAHPDDRELYAQERVAHLPGPAAHYHSELTRRYRAYQQEPSVDQGLELARALIDHGEVEAAAAVLEGLGAEHSDHSGLVLARAYVLERQGRFAAAADEFVRALQLGAEDAVIYDSWLEALAQSPQAVWLSDRHHDLALASTTPAAVRRGYGRLLLQQQAMPLVERWLEATGAPADLGNVLAREAWTARQQQQYDHALNLYDLGLRYYPDRNDLPLGRALVLSEAGQRQRADRAFAALLDAQPRDYQTLDGALAHARRYGDEVQQEQLLSRLLALDEVGEHFVHAWLMVVNDQPVAVRHRKLQAAHHQRPDDPAIGVALAASYRHAEDCEAALETLRPLVPRADLAERAGYLARSCEAPELAARWYRHGTAQESQPRLQAGLMLALGQQGRREEAAGLYRDLLQSESEDLTVLQALADHARMDGDWAAAVEHYEQMLEQAPDHEEAWRGHILARARNGDLDGALARAAERPTWLSAEEWGSLRVEAAAQRLAEAERVPSPQARLLQQEALELLEAGRQQVPPETALWHRLEQDRMVALGRLGRDGDMLAEARSWDADQLPDYVLLALSDAHWRQGEAEAALARVAQVAARQPEDEGLQRRLFYAFLDAGHPQQAEQVLAALVERAEARWDPAGTEPLPWALRQAALMDAWNHRLDAARSRLETYHAYRPDDAEVRLALATVYRWQGLPGRALPLYRTIRELQAPSAWVGEAYAHWDRREFEAVAERVERLQPAAGEREVAELLRDWTLAQQPQLVARTGIGRSSGTTFGSRDAHAEAWLYSAPLAQRYRVYGHDRYAWARLPEGNGRLHRGGIGVDYRGPVFSWRGEVDTSLLDDDASSGVSVSGQWQPTDHWLLSAEAQSYSRDLPLRAIRAGIDGKSLAASVRYAWTAEHWLQGGASRLDFSDDNERTAFWLDHSHHLYGSARHQWTLRESIYVSRSTRGDQVPYYNPERDGTVSLTAEYRGRLPTRTIQGWQHRLALGAGRYWQRNYGGALIGDVEYEHLWQWTPALHFHLGALYRHRTYDGSGEGYWAAFGGLDWRF